MTTTDNQNVKIGIATSVVAHVLLMLVLAWYLGLEATERLLNRPAETVKEEPKVTLLFPEQILPTARLKPKPKPEPRQYIRTTQNEAAEEKPGRADFVSDRNTKAASSKAPYPDGDKPMPTSQGMQRPTLELMDRQYHDGKTADDRAAATPVAAAPAAPPSPPSPLKPTVTPLQPREPSTVPELKPREVPKEMAKADTSTVARMMEDMDKAAGRMDVTKLPFQVKKADEQPTAATASIQPATRPPPTPAEQTSQARRSLENFSPFTRKADVKGTISTKGEDAVNAAATPHGRFMRLVTSAVEKKWHEYRRQREDAVTFGYMKVRFYVNKSGHVEDLKLVEKSGNAIMDSFTLDAILAADLPPIPKDLLPELEEERFFVEYDFIIQ